MGTTLTGTTPQDTYDSLIKVTDNGPLSGSLKTLTDGLGNDSALALSTGAASITGTLSVSSTSVFGGEMRINSPLQIGNGTSVGVKLISITPSSTSTPANIQGVNAGTGAYDIAIQPAGGNVGIGTSAPTVKLDVESGIEGITAGFAGASFGMRIDNGGTFSTGGSTIHGVDPTLVTSYQPLRLNGSYTALCVSNTEVVRATANGLTFNGDTAAANALDDYEEGTWTATLKGSVSDPTTPVTTTGTYTKIGRQVTLRGEFVNVNTSGASGAVSITGVPFLSSAQNTGSVMLFNFDLNTSTAQNCYIGASVNYLEFYGQKNNAAWAELLHNAGAGRYLIFSITYFV